MKRDEALARRIAAHLHRTPSGATSGRGPGAAPASRSPLEADPAPNLADHRALDPRAPTEAPVPPVGGSPIRARVVGTLPTRTSVVVGSPAPDSNHMTVASQPAGAAPLGSDRQLTTFGLPSG